MRVLSTWKAINYYHICRMHRGDRERERKRNAIQLFFFSLFIGTPRCHGNTNIVSTHSVSKLIKNDGTEKSTGCLYYVTESRNDKERNRRKKGGLRETDEEGGLNKLGVETCSKSHELSSVSSAYHVTLWLLYGNIQDHSNESNNNMPQGKPVFCLSFSLPSFSLYFKFHDTKDNE